MRVHRVALVLAFVVVATPLGVGAVSPTPTPGPTTTETGVGQPAMGAQISSFMQASAAQTRGSVETGMWLETYESASNESEKRALIERRFGTLNTTMAELREDRRALQAGYRNGSIDRVTYLARLSSIVGRLAALGGDIETVEARGRQVGIDDDRLDTLRTQARDLAGGEVSRMARNLTGDRGPPGDAGVFDEDHPGRGDGRGPPTDDDRGPPGEDNRGADEDESSPIPTDGDDS